MPKYPKMVATTLARGYTRACDYIFDSDDDATLARGYSRACDYLFDSDDDAQMPLLPIAATPAKSFPPGCIRPPPRMREIFDEAPTPGAVVAGIPKPPPPHAPSFFITPNP